jgi:predicted regulator of Ras-like GTPase activity (Roadblock/LC7/MglB family)
MASHMSERQTDRLVISPEAAAQLAACLQRLMTDSNASLSMVIDRGGRVIVAESRKPQSKLDELGVLIAAAYASLQEVARLLEEESFQTVLHEGLRERIVTETVSTKWLLVVLFDEQVQVGLVRVLVRRTASTLAAILELQQQRGIRFSLTRQKRFRRAAKDTIALLFGQESSEPDKPPSR